MKAIKSSENPLWRSPGLSIIRGNLWRGIVPGGEQFIRDSLCPYTPFPPVLSPQCAPIAATFQSLGFFWTTSFIEYVRLIKGAGSLWVSLVIWDNPLYSVLTKTQSFPIFTALYKPL
jgi:hypothetical protein